MVATALKGKVIWVEKAFFGLAFYLSFPLVTEVAVKAAAAFRKYKKKAHLKKEDFENRNFTISYNDDDWRKYL